MCRWSFDLALRYHRDSMDHCSRSPAKQRPGPRQPAFLMASLERDGLYRPDSMSADIVKPEEAITLSPRQYMPSSHGYSVTKLFSESPTKRPHAVTDHGMSSYLFTFSLARFQVMHHIGLHDDEILFVFRIKCDLLSFTFSCGM